MFQVLLSKLQSELLMQYRQHFKQNTQFKNHLQILLSSISEIHSDFVEQMDSFVTLEEARELLLGCSKKTVHVYLTTFYQLSMQNMLVSEGMVFEEALKPSFFASKIQELEEVHEDWTESISSLYGESAFPIKVDWYEEQKETLDELRLILLLRGATQKPTMFTSEWKERATPLLDYLKCLPKADSVVHKLPEIHFQSDTFEEEFTGYVEKGHPVKIKGFVRDIGRWKFEKLVEDFGDLKLPVLQMENVGTSVFLPLRQLLEDESSYIANSDSLFFQKPELVEELNLKYFEKILHPQEYFSSQTFIGASQKTGSLLHCGYNTNLFFLLDGQKCWNLFDPYYSFLLYPYMQPLDGVSVLSGVGESTYDYELFPLLAFCPRYEVLLESGDILYNPFFWYHTVENLSTYSVAVANRFIAIPGLSYRETCPLHHFVMSFLPFRFGLGFEQALQLVENEKENRPNEAFFEKMSHGRLFSIDPNEMLEAFSLD